MQIRVYYEDTDTGGIVYHSNYLNFCERARSEVFFSRGMTPELENGHFVARKIVADYYRPAKLGDVLDVKTELLEMKNASFSLKQTVYKDDVKLFELVITLAYIDFEGRAQKLNEVKEFLLELF
ncbi:YbgC/FadM family acyl-CoA thioesterase [Sulfurimonas sp.]|uniref:YbgC/FadM family acyl-CoA thioesterase n=1 Tax=Sulfurimonas sp. TaxID=2022749 RepID=UPI0035668277